MDSGTRRQRQTDLWLAIAMAAISAVVWWESSKLAPAPFDPLGPKSFPMWTAGALGLRQGPVMRLVVLPQALRVIIPPMTTEFLTIFKNSSVALTIGVLELTAQARQISEYTFRTFEIFIIATVIYALITLTVTFSMRWLENKTRVPGYIGGAGK
mgnify:CR=1 FL=1